MPSLQWNRPRPETVDDNLSRTRACTRAADRACAEWKVTWRRPGDACPPRLRPFVQLLDQPHHGIVAVEHFPTVGELRARLLQAPPEAMQEVAAGGAAAFDELQVDVGLRE